MRALDFPSARFLFDMPESKKNAIRRPRPEIMAPAGDFACLDAAIKAGADAVYFGIKGFNMRAGAKNF